MSSKAIEKKDFLFKTYVKEFAKIIEFVVDTGADVTCIFDDYVRKYGEKEIYKPDRIILGPDDKELPVLGYLYLNLLKNNRETRIKTYILKVKTKFTKQTGN